MNCGALAATGIPTNVVLILIVAGVCVLAGILLLVLPRDRPGGGRGNAKAATLLIAFVAVGAFLAPSSPARAAEVDCTSATNALTVTQTSTMAGIAPGLPARAIEGAVENHSTDSTFVVAVEVRIASVTVPASGATGTCDASDFVLLDASMPVGSALGAGESVDFAGASIGFADKPVNQDACKLAVVHLHYTANPD